LNLTDDQRDLVKQCLRAAVDGPYFPDWEFGTLIGATRDEIREIIASWPEVPKDKLYLVRSVLGNLQGYPHGEEVRIEGGLIVSETVLEQLRVKLKGVTQARARANERL
jgi:hypothetical protein